MPEILQVLTCVAIGSAFGGMARLFLSDFIARRAGETFPWGTIAVNVTGSFAAGTIAAASMGSSLLHTPAAWQLLVLGFLGSYTTVSSFSLQTLGLFRDGEILRAGGNVALSVAACLSAVAVGYAAGTAAFGAAAP
ncbi:MAG: fluoride efflux transporter CrcB [Alphaproteobacteria bacterium]|nr:fluoride efflux transporter CrcB [Alphaproteobacteria bacterium]